MGDFITGIGGLERCICGILFAGIVAGFRVDGKLDHKLSIEFYGSGYSSRNLNGFRIYISGRILTCELELLAATFQFSHTVLAFVFEHRSVRNLIPFFRGLVPLPFAMELADFVHVADSSLGG